MIIPPHTYRFPWKLVVMLTPKESHVAHGLLFFMKIN